MDDPHACPAWHLLTPANGLMQRLLVGLVLAGFASACAGRAAPAAMDVDAESARVYGAALQAALAELPKPPDVVLVADTTDRFNPRRSPFPGATSAAEVWNMWRSRMGAYRAADTAGVPQLSPDLVADFTRRSGEWIDLRRRLRVAGPGGPYRFLSERDSTSIPTVGTTSYSGDRPYANVVATFSQVGFSEDGQLALVYMGLRCGGLCGAGDLILLRRAPDGWTQVKAVSLWIS